MKKLIFIVFIVLVSYNSSFSQLLINEFMASNTGDFIDPDFSESADWFEVVNKGTNTIDLSNFFFTDNLSDSIKWKLTETVELSPGEFYIFWADGMDQGNHTSFKLSADGEEIGIFDLQGNMIDSVFYTIQESNVSMGRSGNGTGDWVYFIDSTPGETNDNPSFDGIVKSEPYFSILGGIFDTSISLEINNLFEGEIRYTLDGSEPTADDALYNQAIYITESTVVRARIFNGNKIPGPTITHSYFINDETIGDLPVISISSEHDNFWHETNGIYTQSFKPDWEIPINIEMFENDGSDRAGFNLKAGAKINGLYSWRLPQKMLGIYFRKDYGKGKLEYPIFKNSDRVVFDSFSLRASGSDWSYTLFRDAMAQSLTAENMSVLYQEYRPCTVYFNGKYMGIHNLRPKIDRDLVWYNRNLEGVDIDVIENENSVEEGSLEAYKMFKVAYEKDLAIEENYQAVLAMMDEESFTDFMISEIFVRNTSLDHNVFIWKPIGSGEWQWILGDLDRGFFNPRKLFITFFENEGATPFEHLMDNDNYVRYFGLRMANQLFTTFNPNRVNEQINQSQQLIENDIQQHIDRWYGTTSSYGNAMPSVSYWKNEVQDLRTYAQVRPSAMMHYMESYGFGTSKPLSIKTSPANSGKINFNGLKCLIGESNGEYFSGETIQLSADAKAGYRFVGWKKASQQMAIEPNSRWKYFDQGEATDGWQQPEFDDASWQNGVAKLGYGVGGEHTILDYGGSSSSKYPTYYFRKEFSIDPTTVETIFINLLCDDGAVVYLNGVEVARAAMRTGAISYSTLAVTDVPDASKADFIPYEIDKSLLQENNTIAVEVHQDSRSSSDLIFDLFCSYTNKNNFEVVSTNSTFDYTHNEATSIIASFEAAAGCILPASIDTELTLSKDCSPYYVPHNSIVSETGNLIIPAGVELLFDDAISLTVNGKLTVNGLDNAPVYFRSDPNSVKQKWGIVNIVNADTCSLENLIIEDASKGANRITQNAAISIFNSIVQLNKITIENVYANPIAARYSDVTLTNSSLRSKVTGDLINIKYGKGYIENCEFEGNSMPDTDAIDYDDIENGVIKNTVIRNFNGFNSDAIDIGEQAKNILIDHVFVSNITDKGVSVGQQSSAHIQNSTFVNCNLGAGLKDSSKVTIDHCTFYACAIPIACYEKNAGSAGGNAWVTSTILSNAYDESYLVDQHSSLTFSHSLSDSDTIRIGLKNLYANPQFEAPDYLNFSLLASSPAINTGLNGNIGSTQDWSTMKSGIAITGINAGALTDNLEYLVLSNIGDAPIDISSYRLNDGVQFTFGDNVVVDAGENIFITNNKNHFAWDHAISKVFEWEDGRLDNNGEKVALVANNDRLIDQVRYRSENPWPILSAGSTFLSLKVWGSDNHIAENWTIQSFDEVFIASADRTANPSFQLYPNPTNGLLNLRGVKAGTSIKVYDLSGLLVYETKIQHTNQRIDLTSLPKGFYFIRNASGVQKISKL